MKAHRHSFACLMLILLLTAAISGCSFFKNASEAFKGIGKISNTLDKKLAEGQQGKQGEAQGGEKKETTLVDNKVIALRVQEALKREGAEFEKVKVDATKDAVVMTGTVPSEKDRERAAEIAGRVHPDLKLKNELRVAEPPP